MGKNGKFVTKTNVKKQKVKKPKRDLNAEMSKLAVDELYMVAIKQVKARQTIFLIVWAVAFIASFIIADAFSGIWFLYVILTGAVILPLAIFCGNNARAFKNSYNERKGIDKRYEGSDKIMWIFLIFGAIILPLIFIQLYSKTKLGNLVIGKKAKTAIEILATRN
jgi:hypothetical protein